MIVNCPTCGNSGDWCQACDGAGKIVADGWYDGPVLQPGDTFTVDIGDGKILHGSVVPQDIQPKPGTTAPGPSPTRRKR